MYRWCLCRSRRCIELGAAETTTAIAGFTPAPQSSNLPSKNNNGGNHGSNLASWLLSGFWRDHFIPCCPEWTAWKILDIIWLLVMVKLGRSMRWLPNFSWSETLTSNQLFL